MQIKRHYTTEDWYEGKDVDWVITTAEIPGSGFKLEGVRAPSFWSQDAINIVASKYFRRGETSVKDLITRVVGTIADAGEEQGHLCERGEYSVFYDELYYLLVNQHASFNSPVWFNVGVEEEPQCSACFILSVDDDMNSILEWYRNEGLIFKGGSGAGANLSRLRGSMEPLSTSGTASGPVSFMRGADSIAGAIKSGGKTRRAAKMVILDDDHPDLREFIECKVKEERKAKALAREGYDLGLNGEAWSSVQFQNANNSVRVSDEFMRRAITSGITTWDLHPRKGTDYISDDASALLDLMAQSAWECGDPGLQFKDTINRMHTCPEAGEIRASNPCGEYLHLDNTTCNLASINLAKYWKDGEFDVEGFKHTVRVLIMAMDILVDMSSYPTEEIAANAHKYRELGLGYTNLATMLFMAGLPYGSEKGRELAASVTALMNGAAYATSVELGQELGSAGGLEPEAVDAVWNEHMKALPESYSEEYIWNGAFEQYPFSMELQYLRNTQLTLLAPTGTISFMMDCDSTGIEPIYAPRKTKTLVGGGSISSDPSCWPSPIQDPLDQRRYFDPLFATAIGHTDFGGYGTNNRISIEDHLLMLAAVQPHLSGGISKTVNVPEETTPKEIRDLFVRAWELGLKSISIYRDNSKATQVLTTAAKMEDDPLGQEILGGLLQTEYLATQEPRSFRTKLPVDRNAIIHKFDIGGQDGYLTVGLYPNGTPGELFITMSKEGSTLGGLMDSFAVMVSMALQYGVPLADIARKLKGQRFEPAGFTGNAEIPSCTSVVDYIFQWLERRFLSLNVPTAPWIDNYSRGWGIPTLWVDKLPGKIVREQEVSEAPRSAPLSSAEGVVCQNCGSLKVRSGSCFTCPGCGETTGCG